MPLLTCQASDTWQVSDPLPRLLAALREKHAHSPNVEGLSQRFNVCWAASISLFQSGYEHDISADANRGDRVDGWPGME